MCVYQVRAGCDAGARLRTGSWPCAMRAAQAQRSAAAVFARKRRCAAPCGEAARGRRCASRAREGRAQLRTPADVIIRSFSAHGCRLTLPVQRRLALATSAAPPLPPSSPAHHVGHADVHPHARVRRGAAAAPRQHFVCRAAPCRRCPRAAPRLRRRQGWRRGAWHVGAGGAWIRNAVQRLGSAILRPCLPACLCLRCLSRRARAFRRRISRSRTRHVHRRTDRRDLGVLAAPRPFSCGAQTLWLQSRHAARRLLFGISENHRLARVQR